MCKVTSLKYFEKKSCVKQFTFRKLQLNFIADQLEIHLDADLFIVLNSLFCTLDGTNKCHRCNERTGIILYRDIILPNIPRATSPPGREPAILPFSTTVPVALWVVNSESLRSPTTY